MKISPGPAAAQMRAARFTVPPKKSPPSWIGSPVLMPMPMAIRVPVWFRFALPRASWIATAQMIAPFAVVKATMKLSPWVFTTLPPNVSICLRTIALCSWRTLNAVSSPCWLVYSVKPRMSLKRRVTVESNCPDTAGAVSGAFVFLSPRRPASMSLFEHDSRSGRRRSSACSSPQPSGRPRHGRSAARCAPHDAACLELVARQAARGHGRDLEADAERLAERLLDRTHAGGVLELDHHPDLVELAVAEDLDLELVDRREAADDTLDRRRKDVHAADDEHIVEPAEDAALQAHERPPARARRRGHAGAVAGTVTDHGRTERLHPGEPRRGVLAAAGDRERPEGARALEARPEADEEPEREREEHAIRRLDARPAQDEPPAACPPLPRL